MTPRAVRSTGSCGCGTMKHHYCCVVVCRELEGFESSDESDNEMDVDGMFQGATTKGKHDLMLKAEVSRCKAKKNYEIKKFAFFHSFTFTRFTK